ncbi:unnamed protein product [Phytophthora lilii]|uniref:Unnamed protein product n=1 Tax=Phytophthora lilii TaxID=2077276 RepID=A0A9W7D7B3_9STRA|nr:unnamed protein product [Phytophthora lilii]
MKLPASMSGNAWCSSSPTTTTRPQHGTILHVDKCKEDANLKTTRYQKVSSIPSKYETVLHRDPNERNGFGNRTLRFGDCEVCLTLVWCERFQEERQLCCLLTYFALQNELPGPGQYYKPPSLVRSTVDSGSVSRLGYSTGFVSKSKRFNEQVKLVVPGPGQYQPNSSNQSPNASVPGPADYNAAQPSSTYSHNVSKSVFSSKTSRGWNIPTEIPAPGQYENPIQIGQSLRRSPQSIFKSGVKRLGSDATFTPGPGAYNAEDAESALRYDLVAKAHTSAAFHTGNTDRFGRLPGKITTDGELGKCNSRTCHDNAIVTDTCKKMVCCTGPGTYEVPTLVDKLSEKQGSASVFKSKTSRNEGIVGKAQKGTVPGPAFYHPASPEKRSHLLNANKKWL